jgi:hypothetical protein
MKTGNGLKFCSDQQHAKDLITQVLRQDVRGLQQGRGSTFGQSSVEYMCRLDVLVISFQTNENGILVTNIERQFKA